MVFEPDDIVLLQRIASSQKATATAALSELYDRYSRLVFSLAVHMVNDTALAEEITQDVFVLVWNKASTYQSDLGKVSTWLSSVARNRAIDSLRRLKARPEGHRAGPEDNFHTEEGYLFDEALLGERAGEVAVEGVVELHQQRARLQKLLAELPPEQRRALALAYYQGLTQQEISEALHEPLGTVKTRIRLGLQKLRSLLAVEKELLD